MIDDILVVTAARPAVWN